MSDKQQRRLETRRIHDQLLLDELKKHMNQQREYKNDLIDNWAGDQESDFLNQMKEDEKPPRVKKGPMAKNKQQKSDETKWNERERERDDLNEIIAGFGFWLRELVKKNESWMMAHTYLPTDLIAQLYGKMYKFEHARIYDWLINYFY